MKNIQERKIGRTGLSVFPIGLGGMPLSIQGRPEEAAAVKVIQAAVDAGVNFIDTANVYCLDDSDIGHNESLIQKALSGNTLKNRVVIATKGGLTRPQGRWEVDCRPSFLRKSLEGSLRTLKQDSVALYQLHAPDPKVPLEESVGELHLLQKEGKISHIGLSNVSKGEITRALKICRIESVQNRCNPFVQNDLKSGLPEWLANHEIAYIPYSPVGGSYNHRTVANDKKLAEIGKKVGTSSYCVVLSWLLQKGPNVIPIPGASKISSILDSVKSVSVTLPADAIRSIDMMVASS